jgi:hypothetical protein
VSQTILWHAKRLLVLAFAGYLIWLTLTPVWDIIPSKLIFGVKIFMTYWSIMYYIISWRIMHLHNRSSLCIKKMNAFPYPSLTAIAGFGIKFSDQTFYSAWDKHAFVLVVFMSKSTFIAGLTALYFAVQFEALPFMVASLGLLCVSVLFGYLTLSHWRDIAH